MENLIVRLASFVLVLLVFSGCRLPAYLEPISRDLATSRQLSQQGAAAMEQGQWADADSLLAKAVASCPADKEARARYAEALWHRGAREQAVAQLEEVAAAADTDVAVRVRLAEMHLAMGQLRIARAYAEAALDLQPKQAAPWTIRAEVMRAAREPRQALADYHRALGYCQGDRRILLEIAQLDRQLNDPQQALAVLHSLVDTYSPGEEPQQVLYVQGLTYTELGRWDEAVQSLAAAATRGQPTPEILCSLGEAQVRNGNPAAASLAVRQALALDPAHPPSLALAERLQLASQPPSPLR